MKITKIEAIPFIIPYRKEFKASQMASGTIVHADHVLICVYGEDGFVGYGEATPRPMFFGESQKSILMAVDKFYRNELNGMNVLDTEKIGRVLDRYPGNNTTRGALDVAIHDLKARMLGIPLYRLLGGWHNGRVPVTPNVGLKPTPEETADEAVRFVNMGMRTLKVKVGIDPKKDVEVVRQIRRKVGDEIEIYVDANQGWDRESALWAISRMITYGVSTIEEPLLTSDRDGRAMLVQRLPILFHADESVITVEGAMREFRAGVIGKVSIKTPRTGILNSRRIIQTAELFHIPCIIGTQAETGVGTISSAHNGAAYRNIVNTELATYLEWDDDILVDKPRFENGYMILPEAPGTGVQIDPDKLAYYRVG